MKELGEVVPGADSAPKPVSNNPTTAGTAVPPPASLVSVLIIVYKISWPLVHVLTL